MNIVKFIEKFWENSQKTGQDELTHSNLSIRLVQLESYREHLFKIDDALGGCVDIGSTDYST